MIVAYLEQRPSLLLEPRLVPCIIEVIPDVEHLSTTVSNLFTDSLRAHTPSILRTLKKYPSQT